MKNYPPEAASLLAILRRLRAPDGCPWDREQTRQSLVRHLEGECAELIYAIDQNDIPNICEELGDVLMNLFFQVVVAEEKNEFTMEDVWREIISKMIRRHAHVFGSEKADNPEEVAALWQKIKEQEHAVGSEKISSIMDRVKPCLSPLARAEKLQKEAAKCGFDWQDAPAVADKISEELDEVRQAMAEKDDDQVDEELGDLLFSVINLIRFRKKDASEVLRRANLKFERRFRKMEECFAAAGESVAGADAAKFDRFWEEAKEYDHE